MLKVFLTFGYKLPAEDGNDFRHSGHLPVMSPSTYNRWEDSLLVHWHLFTTCCGKKTIESSDFQPNPTSYISEKRRSSHDSSEGDRTWNSRRNALDDIFLSLSCLCMRTGSFSHTVPVYELHICVSANLSGNVLACGREWEASRCTTGLCSPCFSSWKGWAACWSNLPHKSARPWTSAQTGSDSASHVRSHAELQSNAAYRGTKGDLEFC